jgi:hypothetical protein
MKILYCAALLVISACARDASDATDTAGATAAPLTSPAASTPEQAAAVSNAIAANPAAADSILKANGHTPESFEQLMFRIAADSASAATYAAAKTP